MIVFLIILAAILLGNGVMLVMLSRQISAPLPGTQVALPVEERVENYAPMLRMLNREELRFLRSQPGFTPQMEARLRQQRAAMFLMYLKSLEVDFREACLSLKQVIAHSAVDRPDLASLVLRNQVRFTARVTLVRVHVAMYRWGIGTVDVAGILQPFDALRDALQSLTPAAQPTAS
jgi:hypothetical protein